MQRSMNKYTRILEKLDKLNNGGLERKKKLELGQIDLSEEDRSDAFRLYVLGQTQNKSDEEIGIFLSNVFA
jgi:hypothetical protein